MAHRSKGFIPRLRRLFNLPATFDEGSAKFTLPGFYYNDFDRAGAVNIYNVNRILETSRLLAHSEKYNHFYPKDPSGKTLMVMFSQRFSVSPSFHDKVVMNFPMTFQNRIIALGRSSIVKKVSLTEQSSGEEVAAVLQKLVNMNMDTKRSHALIPEMVASYDGIVDKEPDEVFSELRPPSPPANMFSTQCKVRHSDMDIAFHTNQGSYMLYALDCAAEAIKENFYSSFKEDICFYSAKSAATIHLEESFAGDVLGVHSWEDAKNPKLLHFVVSKGEKVDSQIIYYSYIEFWD